MDSQLIADLFLTMDDEILKSQNDTQCQATNGQNLNQDSDLSGEVPPCESQSLDPVQQVTLNP